MRGPWTWVRQRYWSWRLRPDIEQMRTILSQHLVKCDDKGGEMVNRLYSPPRYRRKVKP